MALIELSHLQRRQSFVYTGFCISLIIASALIAIRNSIHRCRFKVKKGVFDL